MLKLPAESVTVPVVVPFTTTVAPTNGSLVAKSVILPFMVFVWANKVVASKLKKTRGKSCFICKGFDIYAIRGNPKVIKKIVDGNFRYKMCSV